MESDTAEESLSVRNFVASRIQEIKTLSSQIAATATPESKGLAFQHVPKHMRRRAVSHNPKRLPKRLREKHLNQVIKSSGAVIKKSKIPSRKYRRRKSNLLSEYNRRQRHVSWMETHIWHAKRFHMKEKWHWKIPISPCDKGYRSLYRGYRDHCVMQDLSYFSFLQLSGRNIVQVFQEKFESSQVMFKTYEHGQKEGKMLFFKESNSKYVGQVPFISLQNSLILWVHPSFKEEAIKEVVSQFDLCAIKRSENNPENSEECIVNIDTKKLIPKNLNMPKMYKTENATLVDLCGSLNRIRLYGPKSLSVLRKVLQPTILTIRSSGSDTWWEEWYKNSSEILQQQKILWESLTWNHEVPWNTIIALTVRDPRIFLPHRRLKVNEIEGKGNFEENLKDYQVISPLWDKDVRERVLKEKLQDSDISKYRSQLLIPGSELHLGWKENQVPVIAIYQSSGWDLIVPAGWAMSFWVALSYSCVRACGHRDSIHFAFEQGSIHAPDFFSPDSESGILLEAIEGQENREKYFRYPPAKRSNLIKLGCPFPFQIDWKTLVNFWSLGNAINNISVVRNPSVLSKIDKSIRKHNENYLPLEGVGELIGVKVLIEGKGTVEEGAVICIPFDTDFTDDQCLELMSEDTNEDKRTTLKKKHDKIMAFLRKKRKKHRDSTRVEEFDSGQICRNFNEEMERLWLPNSLNCLQKMSRKPIGFVTIGGETYSMGKCSGLGFCTAQGIKDYLRSTTRKFVLIRNCRSTLEYRKASLHICRL